MNFLSGPYARHFTRVFFSFVLFPCHNSFSSPFVLIILRRAQPSQFCLFCILFSRVHATLQSALSVHRSVGPSVRRSVGPWTRVEKWENKRFRTFLVADSCISAPAHPSATDGRVSGLVYLSKIYQEHFKTFSDAENLKNTIKS